VGQKYLLIPQVGLFSFYRGGLIMSTRNKWRTRLQVERLEDRLTPDGALTTLTLGGGELLTVNVPESSTPAVGSVSEPGLAVPDTPEIGAFSEPGLIVPDTPVIPLVSTPEQTQPTPEVTIGGDIVTIHEQTVPVPSLTLEVPELETPDVPAYTTDPIPSQETPDVPAYTTDPIPSQPVGGDSLSVSYEASATVGTEPSADTSVTITESNLGTFTVPM